VRYFQRLLRFVDKRKFFSLIYEGIAVPRLEGVSCAACAELFSPSAYSFGSYR
jgi:hypothetical protein